MTALTALLCFTAWTAALVALVFLYRGTRFLRGTPINSWPRGVDHEGDATIAKRLEDAHANCVENLPVFAAIVLAAAAMNRLPAVDALAPWVFYLRVGQTLAHLSGTGPKHVFVRASCWSVQLGLCLVMLARLLG